MARRRAPHSYGRLWRRRQWGPGNTHTVFVGPSVVSRDSGAAFARSVDLTIHPSDLPHFSDALKRSLGETEQVYRIFRETQRALGRA